MINGCMGCLSFLWHIRRTGLVQGIEQKKCYIHWKGETNCLAGLMIESLLSLYLLDIGPWQCGTPLPNCRKFQVGIMASFYLFVRLALEIIILLMLAHQALGHDYYYEPELNVIPGKGCGLQTEMRFLDALGKYIFFYISNTNIMSIFYQLLSSDEHTELRPCTVVKDTASFKKFYLDLKPSKDNS